MIIETNTDNHFTARADLKQLVEGTLEDELGHLTARLTRVEVHIGDVNGHKGGDSDLQCSMEARPEGHQRWASCTRREPSRTPSTARPASCGAAWITSSAG